MITFFFKKPPPQGSETILEGSEVFHRVHGRLAFLPSFKTRLKFIKFGHWVLWLNINVYVLCSVTVISGIYVKVTTNKIRKFTMLEQIQKFKLKSRFTSLNSCNPIIEIAQNWIYWKKNSISKEEKKENESIFKHLKKWWIYFCESSFIKVL